MKKLKLLYFIALCILFQSCSSYKSAQYNDIKNEKDKKYKVVMNDRVKVKGTFVNKDVKNIYLQTWDGKILKIPKEGINELKIKEFNVLKTFGGTVGYIGMLGLGGYGIYLVMAAIFSTG
tara:strand:- start:44 stop:403 length:360 start_codon:yes stop_codon:yes gene_type:complete